MRSTRSGPGARVLATAAALAACLPVRAFEFDTDPAWSVRLDTSVRYNLGVRTERIDPALGNSPNYDETDWRFRRGQLVTNRIDLLSEFDVAYASRFGARLSAAAWVDFAYDGRARTNPGELFPGLPYSAIGSYENNEYSPSVKRFSRGPSAEVLDAFVFANFERAKLKAGQMTNFWGESLYTQFHGIAYSQAPLDGRKATASPGIGAKEVFLPIAQLAGQFQLTPTLSLGAHYVLDWKPNRLPEGGTYFGAADLLFEGPDRTLAGFGADGSPLFVPRAPAIEPRRKHGNFGLNLRWDSQPLGGVVGLYWRRFDETQPWPAVFRLDPATFAPLDYHQTYARGTRMLALSYTTTLGPVSVGSELVYRRNTALNSTSFFAATGDFAGVEGARGNTWHAVVNGIYLLPKTPLWETGELAGELVYSRLSRVTKNAALFNGVGYACPAGQGKDEGCSTKDVLLVQFNIEPRWLQVWPGWDLSAPASIAYGLHGNGATLGGGNEGASLWSVGLAAKYRDNYSFSLKYNDSHARMRTDPSTGFIASQNGNAAQNDHGWLSFTFQTSF
jgi:hypothetical protein